MNNVIMDMVLKDLKERKEKNSLDQLPEQQKRDMVTMANAISQSIFGKPVLSLGPKLQQKIALAVVNIIKDLKGAKNVTKTK